MVKARLKTKILIRDSMREMPIGSVLTIKNTQAKAGAVRTTACDLKKEGFLFEVSDKGRIDDVIVTRIK